jgi:hypothetical protein
MAKKINWLEIIAVVPCALFLIMISLYHVSFYGHMGFPRETWKNVWAISENGLLLSLCTTIIIFSYGPVRRFFTIVLVPYFSLKILYHISCYFNIYLWSPAKWENVWSYALVFLLIATLIYCLILIRRKDA